MAYCPLWKTDNIFCMGPCGPCTGLLLNCEWLVHHLLTSLQWHFKVILQLDLRNFDQVFESKYKFQKPPSRPLTSQVIPLRIFFCKMQLQSSYLSNFCHDVSVFSCVQVVDLTGVRVQIVQKWWVICSEGIVGTAYGIRIGVGTQESAKRRDYHQSPNLVEVLEAFSIIGLIQKVLL